MSERNEIHCIIVVVVVISILTTFLVAFFIVHKAKDWHIIQ